MGWERIKPTIKELSDPPSLMAWLLAGLVMLIIGVLLFILHASGTVKFISAVNIWCLSLAPVGVWFVLSSLRGWLWGKEIDQYQFQQKEREYGQLKWEAWAERHLAILGSGILLPNGVNANNVIAPDLARMSHFSLSCRIVNKSSHEAILIKRCLASIQSEIESLPFDLPLNVTLVTDIPAQYDLVSSFNSAWRELFPIIPVPGELSCVEFISMGWGEARLKQPVLTVDLILVLQVYGNDIYSDGLAALLLTSDDVAQKYNLAHSARLLRPMSLNVAKLKDEFSLFLDTQTIACRTSRIFADAQYWGDYSADLLTVGAEKKASWLPDEIVILEKLAGVMGPAGPWLLTALAAEVADCGNTSLLTLFTTESEHFVSSVIPGNKNG